MLHNKVLLAVLGADLLLQRNGPDDEERAMTLLNEALAISPEPGMRPLTERVVPGGNC